MSGCDILLGDSLTLADHIEGQINCICTDPPYGVAFLSNSSVTPRGDKWVEKIANDDDPELAIDLFLRVMAPLVAKCADQAEMYVFTSWKVIGPWLDAVAKLEPFVVKNLLVWEKGMPGMGDVEGNWPNSYELIIYAKKGRRPIGSRRPSVVSVQRVDKDNHIHPTEKPVPLLEILLEQSTKPGDLVVDPFAGSGSTIVAASRLGRRGLGMEMNPRFHERAIRRLDQNFFDI